MNCVRPPCRGVVADDGTCRVCGLQQRFNHGRIEVAGPVKVTYFVFPDDERTIAAERVLIRDHYVTVSPVANAATVLVRRGDLLDIINS